jgi:hypothetical protein
MLPWSDGTASDDPHTTVGRFADRVYDAAVELGAGPTTRVGERVDGWQASRNPTFA